MMTSRREAIALLGSMSAGPLLPRHLTTRIASALRPHQGESPPPPPLAPGAPNSPERTALIAAFRQQSAGIEQMFEARSLKRDWEMPAGGHPIYTEYAGVKHESWQWAYTEPALPAWLFPQRRPG